MRWILVLAAGCGEVGDTVEGPTYHQDVAPVLVARCGVCHQDGGIGPFGIGDYETAKQWAEPIAESIEAGRMPPFFAAETDECDMRIGIADDPRLSEDEKALIRSWVDAGAPEGDPETAAPAAVPEPNHIVDPNVVLELQEPFAVEGDRDIYQCFRIPMPNTTDVWVTELEVLPGNPKVVHHVLVWNDPGDESAQLAGTDGSYPCSGQPDVWPTEIVGTWTPGSAPSRTPPNSGTLVHPGASLVLNIHYHPVMAADGGTTTEVDDTRIALKWTDQQPAQHTTWFLIDLPFGASTQPGLRDEGGPEFRIPGGDPKHRETVSLTIPPYLGVDLPVFAITPHMHYLGSEMLVTLRRESGFDECLIHTPTYRFDFQTNYEYDRDSAALPVMRIGDTVDVRCTYNNSHSNPFMPLHLEASGQSEPHDVWWGEETSDEMCMAMVGLLLPPADWLDLLGGAF